MKLPRHPPADEFFAVPASSHAGAYPNRTREGNENKLSWAGVFPPSPHPMEIFSKKSGASHE
jgi:hypothetical protein